MLRFDEVIFSYHPTAHDAPVLDCVSLTIEPGQEVAVVGANGSGKSTLARLANGILLPQSGAVTVDGASTADAGRIREIRELVSVVFQHPDDQIVATSVEDEVAFGPENLGLPRDEIRQRVDSALQAAGLIGLERREPHLLSGGQKQRLAIAGALAMQPAYLVLDEPTSMLDPLGRAEVLDVVRRLRRAGHGILHITHDLAAIASADRVVVLEGGRLVFEGSVAELFERAGSLSDWGLEVPVITTLAWELRKRGATLPAVVTDPQALAEALWG